MPALPQNRRVTESDLNASEAVVRNEARPAPAAPAPSQTPPAPVFVDPNATVTIMRNLKGQDYKVVRDIR